MQFEYDSVAAVYSYVAPFSFDEVAATVRSLFSCANPTAQKVCFARRPQEWITVVDVIFCQFPRDLVWSRRDLWFLDAVARGHMRAGLCRSPVVTG